MMLSYCKEELSHDALSSVCLNCIKEAACHHYENDQEACPNIIARNIKLIHTKKTTIDGLTYILKFHVFPFDNQNKISSLDQILVAINGEKGSIKAVKYSNIKSYRAF